MKIGIFSDLHGNADALQALMDKQFPTVDEIWCLGDLFFNYKKDDASKQNALNIMGILESFAVKPIDFIAGNTDMENEYSHFKKFFSSLTFHNKLVANIPMVLTHGHLYETDDTRKALLIDQKSKILLSGHTHLYGAKLDDNLAFINVGSAGAPRDGNSVSCFVVFDADTKCFTFKELFSGDIVEELYVGRI